MSNRAYAFLAIVAAGLFVLYNSMFIVNEREKAIVLRFSEIQRVIDEPGLYFKLPFSFARADNVQKLSDMRQRLDLGPLRVQTAEGLFYDVDAFLVYRIQNAGQFRQNVDGGRLEVAEQRLRSRFDSAIRAVYGRRSFESALSDERVAMMVEVRDQVRPEAENLGLSLDDVRIRRTDLGGDVAGQTFERMRTERTAEAEGLRANGRVAAAEIRAAADREVVETIAGARRDAEILQGEGEAERNSIFAGAFGANPEFFEFYRSMQAYRGAMENAGTTMVLSPDSDFFRYFNANVDLPEGTTFGGGAAAPTTPPAAGAGEDEEIEGDQGAANEASPAELTPGAQAAREAAEAAARAIAAGEEPPSVLGSDAPEGEAEEVPADTAPAQPAPAN
ncbi:SPFH domain-containing protein [Aureimonas mangrovi]|uniref:SPFH domain-containing protein n=1 Tax=Aureimonas mangrovi TaxID=2758041 RepID=UPI00163D42DE